MMISKAAQLDNIMATFDFAFVADAMKKLDWRWTTLISSNKTPTEDDLRRMATYLLGRLDENCKYLACGGLVASRSKGVYFLTFELTSAWGNDEY